MALKTAAQFAKQTFDRRKRDGVERPAKGKTDLSFAAHLAMKTMKTPEIPFSQFTRKVKP
jgi:hypothetical protein